MQIDQIWTQHSLSPAFMHVKINQSNSCNSLLEMYVQTYVQRKTQNAKYELNLTVHPTADIDTL